MALNGFIKNAARDPSHGVRARRNAQQMATAPKALNPISGQMILLEIVNSGSLPAYGNPGRIVWASDNERLYVDNGTAWRQVALTA